MNAAHILLPSSTQSVLTTSTTAASTKMQTLNMTLNESLINGSQILWSEPFFYTGYLQKILFARKCRRQYVCFVFFPLSHLTKQLQPGGPKPKEFTVWSLPSTATPSGQMPAIVWLKTLSFLFKSFKMLRIKSDLNNVSGVHTTLYFVYTTLPWIFKYAGKSFLL